MIPAAVTGLGYEVSVQTGAGVASGYLDLDCWQAGAINVSDAAILYGEAKRIVKLVASMPAECGLLRANHSWPQCARRRVA